MAGFHLSTEALVPVVAIGLNWKRASAPAATTAIIVSLLINIGSQISGITPPMGIDVGALSMVMSLVLFVGISLMIEQPKLHPDVEAIMDL